MEVENEIKSKREYEEDLLKRLKLEENEYKK